MNKIVKTTSIQSGPFTATQNLVDFNIPGGRQYDLRNAYVNLTGLMTQTDASASATKPVYNWQSLWLANDMATPTSLKFDNSSLVRNARFTSSSKGLLEDIRRVDVLRQQLKTYTKSEDEYRSTLYKALSQVEAQNNLRLASNIEFKSLGTQMSRLNNVNVQIPLSDIFELGKTDNLPCNSLGNCRIHLELNLDRLGLTQNQGAGTRNNQFGNIEYTTFEDSVAATDITSVETKVAFLDMANSPFWVGQQLSFSGTGAGTGPPADMVTEVAVVTNIVRSTATNKLTLTLDRTVFTAGAGEYQTGITADGVNFASIDLTWTDAQLVIEEKATIEPMDELQYMTYTNEEDNGTGLTAFSRQYGVEQECFNLMVCLPDVTTGLTCTNPGGTQYSDYRLRLDNKDLTNRQVDYKDPLYYDRIAMFMLNQNLPLKSLTESHIAYLSGYASRFTAAQAVPSIFIGNPLPITPQRKLVQININGTGVGVNEIQLFKSVIRNMKL